MPASSDLPPAPDRLVVGAFNREALDAARSHLADRAVGRGPVGIRGPAGSGRSFLLEVLEGEERRERPGRTVVRLSGASLRARHRERGDEKALDPLRSADTVLLDDLDELAPDPALQAALLQLAVEREEVAWVVTFTSDEPLEAGLRGWLGGGRVVELGRPAPAVLERILRQEAELEGIALEDEEVARRVAEADGSIARLVGGEPEGASSPPDEFGSFLTDISTTVADLMEGGSWRERIAEAILRWEGEGYRTRRLETLLEREDPPDDVEAELRAFEAAVRRLTAVREEAGARDPTVVRSSVYWDPDRIEEARRRLEEMEPDVVPAGSEGEAASPGGREESEEGEAWIQRSDRIEWSWTGLDGRLVERLG